MCGIAGIVDFARCVIDPGRLLAMAATLRHRGPDGEGAVFFTAHGERFPFCHLDPRRIGTEVGPVTVGLAHRRLAIIDLTEQGAQPMADENEQCWINFIGEIYNYIELLQELIGKGHRFRSRSDTEVILHAYLEWGTECVRRFNGMFAFALWDNRERRLFCARDHLGIKPFYYWYHQQRIIFASEQKAVLSGLERKPSPNVAAMADYLSFSYVTSTETMFDSIVRLAPGSFLLADEAGYQVTTYWDPAFDPAPQRREEDWAQELTELLDDAIRLQVRSDVPVGAHLSGGIDSSTVSCLAAKRIPKLLTFTARFREGGFFDETPYARLVAKRIGSDYREIVPERTQLAELLPRILYHLDEPVEAASIFGKYYVAQKVSQSVKVVLGGQGGDELFGGYDWYVKNLFTAAVFSMRRNRSSIAQHSFLWDTIRNESPKRLIKSLSKNFGETDLGTIFCRNWSRLDQPQLTNILNPEVVAPHVNPQERFLARFNKLQERRAGDRMFKFDMQHYLEALLTSEDRLSMAFSVESRVPILDYRVAELAGKLGFELKAQPGCSKRILRKAMHGIVPSEILERRDKRGFPTPIQTWLRDPDLNLLQTMVFNDNSFAKRYFNISHIEDMSRARSHFSTDWSERLWRILNLSVWGQVFELS